MTTFPDHVWSGLGPGGRAGGTGVRGRGGNEGLREGAEGLGGLDEDIGREPLCGILGSLASLLYHLRIGDCSGGKGDPPLQA